MSIESYVLLCFLVSLTVLASAPTIISFLCEKLDASECFNLGGNQNISMWDLNLEEQFLQKMFL